MPFTNAKMRSAALAIVACLASFVVARPTVNEFDYTFPGTIDEIKQKLAHITADDLHKILGDKYGQPFEIHFKNQEDTLEGTLGGQFYHS